MAILNGVLSGAGFSLPSGTSPNENLHDANFANGLGSPTAKRTQTVLTDNQPTTLEPRKTLNGQVRRSFGDLWFNRIHVIKSFINVGNLTASQTKQVEIFNGYLSSDAILTSVDATDTDGLNLDYGTLPQTIKSLRSLFLELTIDESGAPEFDSSFEFTITGKDAPDLRVTGVRVVTFPFRHNWTESYRERLEYLTDIEQSENGTEQRRMFRNGVPRRSVAQNVLLHSTTQDDIRLHAQIRNKFVNLLRGWQHRTLAIGILSDEEVFVETLPMGSVSILTDTTAKDYTAGAYVMPYINESTFDVIEIASVAADRINLARPTSRDYPAGSVFSPAYFARLSDSQNFNEIAKGSATATVEFDLLEEQEYSSRELAHGMPQYLGRSVWTRLSNPSDDKSHNITRQTSVIDAATGLVWRNSNVSAGRETTLLEHYFLDRTEIGEMFGWFAERKGALVEFWYPTDEFDFIVVENIGANTASLTVDNTDFARFVYEQNSNNHVCVKMVDGSYFFREIIAAVTNDDGGLTESITLNAPLSTTTVITPQQIDRVCFLRLVRLTSDKQEIEWLSVDEVAWLPSVIDVLGEENSPDGF